jgi:lipopolysaccharide/colanic/teichoic acid biosynthesis glycosyltransferase
MAINARLPRDEELPASDGAGRSYRLKRPGDILVAGLALLALGPLLALLALLILLFSGRPVLYKARRLGHHGRVFTMYKFRTMVPDAESLLMRLSDRNLSMGMIKIPNDPRVTGIGWWLRRFSLDELPQLWNVLRGQMSIVGPRPHDVNELREAAIDPVRLNARPGLTGLWQLRSRHDPSLDARVHWDRLYVARCSLTLDLRLMLETVPALLRGQGGHVAVPGTENSAEPMRRRP